MALHCTPAALAAAGPSPLQDVLNAAALDEESSASASASAVQRSSMQGSEEELGPASSRSQGPGGAPGSGSTGRQAPAAHLGTLPAAGPHAAGNVRSCA